MKGEATPTLNMNKNDDMIMPTDRLGELDEIEYKRFIVLNTSHLPRAIAEAWETPIPENVPREVVERVGVCIPYGYMMWIHEVDYQDETPLAPELVAICRWAQAYCEDGVGDIIFDRDGPVISALPTYDW